jgi:hypothetical protein
MHERKCHLASLLGLGVLGAAASPSENPRILRSSAAVRSP